MEVTPEANRKPVGRGTTPLVILTVLLIAVLISGGVAVWLSVSLHADNDLLRSQYDKMRGEVNLRLGQGEDCKAFVTPSDGFIAAKVFAIAGTFTDNVSQNWAGWGQLYDWVVENIEYSSDSRLPILPALSSSSDMQLSWEKEYWRTPKETLEDETGDCEDMAVLLASMILNYTSSKYSTWVITWTSESSSHAAVAIPVQGGNLTILDPAGDNEIGLHGSLPASDAVADWLGDWPSELGIHVTSVFSNTTYETFTSTSEFLEWVTRRT